MAKVILEISEHAILRWLERVYRLDLDEIRAEIHAAVFPAAEAGAVRVSTRGVTACIQLNSATGNKIVATVLPAQSGSVAQIGMAHAGGYAASRRNSPSHADHGRRERRRARGLKDSGA